MILLEIVLVFITIKPKINAAINVLIKIKIGIVPDKKAVK